MRPVQSVFAALGVALLLGGCFTGEGEARRAVEAQGMTRIETLGAAVWSCSESDKEFGQKFRALNPNGRPVEGVVCCGLFKGCTVRW